MFSGTLKFFGIHFAVNVGYPNCQSLITCRLTYLKVATQGAVQSSIPLSGGLLEYPVCAQGGVVIIHVESLMVLSMDN